MGAINKFKEFVKVFLLLISFIIILNKIAVITGTIIHVYLFMFIVAMYVLNKFNIYKMPEMFRIYNKDFKVTFILCFFISLAQIFSFKFIYPSMYSNINLYFNNIIWGLIWLQILNCVIEEIFFRGYVLQVLNKTFTNKERLFISVIIFAIYHVIMYDVSSIKQMLLLIIFTGSAGLCLGYVYMKTENLLPSILIHMAYNISQNIIALEFNIVNLGFKNMYIQFMYPATIFLLSLLIYIFYNKVNLKRQPTDSISSNDDIST